MESSNSGNDLKHKPCCSFWENGESSRGSSSNNGNSWQESNRRDHGKKREASRDPERSRDRTLHGKSSIGFLKDEDSRDTERQDSRDTELQQPSPQQPPQAQSSFPNYSNYSATENSFVENERRAFSMMPTHNYLAAMNSPWGVNCMDSMVMTPSNMPVNPSSANVPITAGVEITPTVGSGMNPYSYMGIPGDNNMYGMMGMGNYCHYGMMNGQENMMLGAVKEVVKLSKSVLHPPNPNAPPPTTRGKPLGCKTIFVGGLPEKITEEILKEVFDKCGEIVTIRMSKKNFCHIRFSNEAYVENALYFSGYRMKIENKEDAAYTGRLHVDYAQARDDQYDYEVQQRAIQREARHRERMEQDCLRPPTPPPIVHYSEHEETLLREKLRSEETFAQAVFVLTTWLERGECNKRNAGSFYSMIQSTNSHITRLMNEKAKYEEELNKAKKMLKQQMQSILIQLNEIGKVFNTACLQKVWDQFTKQQRKNIELWKKQTEELKNAHVEEVLNDRVEDEMDLSEEEKESDDVITKKTQDTSQELKEKFEKQLSKLREENDSLRCQLKAAENETMVLKSETEQELESKETHIKVLREALKSSAKEIDAVKRKRSNDEAEMKELRACKSRRSLDKESQDSEVDQDFECIPSSSTTVQAAFCESEARLIGLVSTFLHVHPFGANIDYICSYLHQIDPSIQPRDVENLMKRFPTVFKEDSTGIGASLGKKWRFLGFE